MAEKAKKGKGKVVKLGKETKSKEQVNPNEFGYRKDQLIEVNANFLMELLFGFANHVQLQETKVGYEVKEDFKDTLKAGKTTISDLGVQAVQFMDIGMNLHMDNIEKGVAVHQSVLAKEYTANLELESVSTDEVKK